MTDTCLTRHIKLPLSTSLTDPDSDRGEGSEKFLGVINGESVRLLENHA